VTEITLNAVHRQRQLSRRQATIDGRWSPRLVGRPIEQRLVFGNSALIGLTRH
jgi:hypothetical protein